MMIINLICIALSYILEMSRCLKSKKIYIFNKEQNECFFFQYLFKLKYSRFIL